MPEKHMLLKVDKNISVGEHLNHCPSCKASSMVVLGSIPKAMHFCSFEYSHGVNNSKLIECGNCGLYFKNPCLSAQILDSLYEKQPQSTWSASKSQREDFKQVSNSLNQFYNIKESNHLLDIGCFNGELIEFLKKQFTEFEYFGIEPSKKAARHCSANNINIIGSTLNELAKHKKGFNIVTLIDVFEHIQDTHSIVKTISSKLADDGLLVIITGATDSRNFNKFKEQYYYACMPEHIAFISKKHAIWLSEECALELIEYRLFDRRVAKEKPYKYWLQNTLFRLLQYLPDKMLSINNKFARRLSKYRSMGYRVNKKNPDHAIVVFRKKANMKN